MKRLLFILILLISTFAIAAPPTINLTFEEPTTNTDSSALDNLAYYQGYCSTTPNGPYVAEPATLPAQLPAPPLNSVIAITLTNCMTTEFGNVYFVLQAVNLFGDASPYTNEASVNFPPPTVYPSAPANLKVIEVTL